MKRKLVREVEQLIKSLDLKAKQREAKLFKKWIWGTPGKMAQLVKHHTIASLRMVRFENNKKKQEDLWLKSNDADAKYGQRREISRKR